MGRLRSHRVLAVTLMATCAVGLVGPSQAAAPGQIVFASDRDKSDPGEIYSLTSGGGAPRDVSNSLAAETELAVDPVGNLIAFWSDRSGQGQVYLARSDGSGVRLVRSVGSGVALAEPEGDGGFPLLFSTDGARLFASEAITAASGATVFHDFLINTRTATARALPTCAGIFDPSPDGAAVACGVKGATTVSDLAGHVRARLPGAYLVWSSRGSLAVSGSAAPSGGSTTVVDESGARLGHVTGVPIAWSHDGQLLLFQRGQALWAGDPHAFARARLLLRGWPGGLLSFTPDNRYVSTEGAGGKPLLVPLAGGKTLAGLDGGGGVWSRTGRLAYYGQPAQPVRPGATLPVLMTDTHGRNPKVVGRFPYDDHAIDDLRWLPDGRTLLALTSNSCGGKGLYVVSTAGGAARRLNTDPRDLESPTWSPDGSLVAYSVGPFGCHLGEGESVHIETVHADGTGVRQVTDDGNPQQGSFDSGPVFSPDGTQIALSHGTFDSGTIQTVAASGGARTSLLPPAGANVGSTPAWSPDGTRIAYLSGPSIMAVPPAGGTPVAIATNPDPDSCSGLAWSPDGTELATACAAGIYVIVLGPPASARLAISAQAAANPAFSPDGTQIAFDASPPDPLGNQSAIIVANTDGTGLHVLSTVPFHQSVHPSWLPSP
jgi:Tol biopolymer transport system component